MKKKIILGIIIILVIFSVFALYKFYQISKNYELAKEEIEKVKSEQEKNYFDKKIECEKFTESVKKEIEEMNDGFFLGSTRWYFDMIFYSSKEDSCLYAVERFPDREYFVYNALTHHRITSFKFSDQWEDYKNFIFEYSDGEIRL